MAGEMGSPLGSLSLRASEAGSMGSGEPIRPLDFADSIAFFMSFAPRSGAASFLVAMVHRRFTGATRRQSPGKPGHHGAAAEVGHVAVGTLGLPAPDYVTPFHPLEAEALVQAVGVGGAEQPPVHPRHVRVIEHRRDEEAGAPLPPRVLQDEDVGEVAPLRQFPSRRASRPHDSGSRARWQSGHLGSQSVSCRAMASRMVAKESA